ncbi:hypothetical protein AB5L52_21590 [Streptomyces sp. CG4]|uniref:hypothetical protein n=1 Tax=Streptomyces sp. CG4 TaxID=408783 RepID=UPI0034E26E2B
MCGRVGGAGRYDGDDRVAMEWDRTGRTLLNKADDAVSVVEESLTAAFETEERATFREFLERCSSALKK